jgi:hypothetical protein
MNIYYLKYLKYKNKYVSLKNQTGQFINFNSEMIGGNKHQLLLPRNIIKRDPEINDNLDFFFNFNNKKNEILDQYKKFVLSDPEIIIESELKNINKESFNSITSELKIKNKINNHNFDLILKFSDKQANSNLYYEYYAGQCINIVKEYVPNFVYTFQYFNLPTDIKNEIKSSLTTTGKYSNVNNITKNSEYLHQDKNQNILSIDKIDKGCRNNDKSFLVIEKVPNSFSLDEILEDVDFNEDLEYNMFSIIYQLYSALNIVKNNFTHYDLHHFNVIFIKLDNYIQINYKSVSNTSSTPIIRNIFTRFIPVIIDYGSVYVNCIEFPQSNILSSLFTEIACESNICNTYPKNNYPKCSLKEHGIKASRDEYNYFLDNREDQYKNIRIKSNTHDLRFLLILTDKKSKIKDLYIIKELYNILHDAHGNRIYKDIMQIYDALNLFYLLKYNNISKHKEVENEIIITTDMSLKERWIFRKK